MENEKQNEQHKHHVSNGHPADKYAPILADQVDKLHEKKDAHQHDKAPEGAKEEKKGPAGGFDSTPIPRAAPGYTLKFTFHRATNLPFADLNSLSSDPFIVATLNTDLQKRHKQDPDTKFRTPTIRRNTSPEWNCDWIVAHVPASGFFLKCRIYDEDPADHDDRLGNVHVRVNGIGEQWSGIHEQPYKIKKRMGSKRAYMFRGCAAMFSKDIQMSGEVFISVECLGRSEGNGGRTFTIGPLYWTKHYSPLIGRLTGTKNSSATDGDGQKTTKYNFQAAQVQLRGPVPESCYHRYVEFKPFVAGMFNSHTLKGRILNHALHHQHARIYQYDRSTVYGLFPSPSEDMTRLFLDLVSYAEGGRIFTYVLTLDAHWRFTETGKEFGIDMLSKHTMHSDVSIYIAFSGEFFIRKIKHHRLTSSDPSTSSLPTQENSGEHEENPTSSKDPSKYELFIDNDSGTYRPNAKYLPALKEFMSANLPGLKINTLDCQADADRMGKLKNEQREKKKAEGASIIYMQGNSSSVSLSSSDEEELEERAQGSQPKSKLSKGVDNVKDPKKNIMQWVGKQAEPPKDGPSHVESSKPKEEHEREDKVFGVQPAEEGQSSTAHREGKDGGPQPVEEGHTSSGAVEEEMPPGERQHTAHHAA